MIVRFERRSCKPITEISTSSIIIVPLTGSIIRNSASAKELLPEIQNHRELLLYVECEYIG